MKFWVWNNISYYDCRVGSGLLQQFKCLTLLHKSLWWQKLPCPAELLHTSSQLSINKDQTEIRFWALSNYSVPHLRFLQGHFPSHFFSTPSHLARQAFKYSFPFSPQTGALTLGHRQAKRKYHHFYRMMHAVNFGKGHLSY